MKARFAWFAGLSILLSTSLLFSPFLVNAAPGRQPSTSDGEPNNSYGTATPIDVASTIQGTITPSDDEDWYTLNVDHQGELKIAITNVAPELTIDVRVWNADKSTVSDWFAPLSAGGDTSAVVDLIEAGQYYLEVADDQGNAQSDQPYSLQTTFTSTADTSEPNNDYGSAPPIEIGQPLQANILPANDEDWYNFEVAKQGELTL